MLCQNSSPSHFHSQKERKKPCPWSGPTTWKIKSLTTVNPQDNFHLEQQLCRTLICTHLYTLHFSGLPRQGNLLVYALLSLCPAHSHHLPVLMEAARAPMPTTLQHLLHPGPPQKYMPYPLTHSFFFTYQLYWRIIAKYCIYLMCTMWLFDIYIDGGIIIKIKIINTYITSHSSLCVMYVYD